MDKPTSILRYAAAMILSAPIPVKRWRRAFKNKLLGRPTGNILVYGSGNEIELANPRNKVLKVTVFGDNNQVKIETTDYFSANIFIGTKDCPISNCTVRVGPKATSGGVSMRLLESDSSINIGEDSMLSSGICIFCSDTHSIFNVDGELANIGKSVEIGRHVWIGQDCKILKNTRIADDCIVGMGSIVTKRFCDKNCIIAGVPAKVIKENMSWSREHPQQYMNKHG